MTEKEQLFKFLRDTLNQTKDIAIDQAPLVMQEWAKMRMIQSLVYFTISLFCFIAAFVCLNNFCLKKINKDNLSEAEAVVSMFTAAIFILISAISIMVIYENTPIFFSAWLTPKAFLLQEFLR